MEQSTTSQLHEQLEGLAIQEVVIPSALKFLIANIKTIISTQLTSENYSSWRSQNLKLFHANGFRGFLDGSTSCHEQFIISYIGVTNRNPLFDQWLLID